MWRLGVTLMIHSTGLFTTSGFSCHVPPSLNLEWLLNVVDWEKEKKKLLNQSSHILYCHRFCRCAIAGLLVRIKSSTGRIRYSSIEAPLRKFSDVRVWVRQSVPRGLTLAGSYYSCLQDSNRSPYDKGNSLKSAYRWPRTSKWKIQIPSQSFSPR